MVFFIAGPYTFGQKKLPVIIGNCDSSRYLVFHITGDGGWRGFDIKLANEFKVHEMSYRTLNAFRYFWSAKSPDQLAKDMTPLLRDYLIKLHRTELVLVGFSFGAEIMPFLFNRLPEDIQVKVKQIVLITPAGTSDFAIHLTDMIGAEHTYEYNVVSEVEKIKMTRVLTIFGSKERSTFPENHKQDNVKILFVKGSHHFTDARAVMDIILQELE
jgi:type IV secretory pathway VirJ component